MSVPVTVAWHGSAWRFRRFDPQYIGRGEANAQGAGFYFSEKRAGAEKIQRYLQFREGSKSGYVYRVGLSFRQDELADFDTPFDEQPAGVQRRLLRAFSTAARRAKERYSLSWLYSALRQQRGDREAATTLRDVGLVGFQMYEGDNDLCHGHTIVMLAPERIEILSREQWVEDKQHKGTWQFVETL